MYDGMYMCSPDRAYEVGPCMDCVVNLGGGDPAL